MFKQSVPALTASAVAAMVSLAADAPRVGRSSAIAPVLRHVTPRSDSQPKLPAGLTLVDWKQIKAEYERHRHGMFPDGKGGYQSRSHYHGWLARFDGNGIVVDSDTESWNCCSGLTHHGSASGREIHIECSLLRRRHLLRRSGGNQGDQL